MKKQMHILGIAALAAWATFSPDPCGADAIPQIVTQPQNQMLLNGSSVTFSVTASGGNLHYQWYLDDTFSIFGATNASLTLTNLQAPEADNYSVVVTNLAGSTNSSDASLTVLTVLTGPVNPYAPGTLGNDLFQGTFTLASSTNKTAAYRPNLPGLGTNSTVWTWPINLSCVGYASDGYQSVLIASDKLLVCAHYGGEAGQTVTFHDTNGVAWVGVVTNVVNVIADMDIAMLSNAAPASIVLPYVLPPDYTSYIAGATLLGMPAFWLHKNTGQIDYVAVAEIADADWYGFGTWIDLLHDDYGIYSGTAASGGDSGSPAFLAWSNNPILLFATTLTPDSAGMFVSGADNWTALAALGLTNGMRILDLSGYPLQPPVLNAFDYEYLTPPADQVASPGSLVTFSVSACVFGASPFTYQWRCNGTNVPDATAAVLTLEAVPGNVGSYSVILSNSLGVLTSGPATLQLETIQGEPLLPNWGMPGLLIGLGTLGVLFLGWRPDPAPRS